MKNLKALKKYTELKLKVKFNKFPGKVNRKGCFEPQRDDGDSRFWLFFKKNKEKTFCVFGDHAVAKNEAGHKYSVDIMFDPPKLSDGSVNDRKYRKSKEEFKEKATSLMIMKGYNSYLKEFKKFPPTCYVSNVKDMLYVPYRGKDKNLKGLLRIFKTGKKLWLPASEPQNAFHFLREPELEKSFYYICEGIKTAYAVLLGANENAGILSAGGFNNIENAIKYVLEKKHHPVLCVEKECYEKYVELKTKYNCYMVGSQTHEDIYDFYKQSNLDMLKKNLVSFQQDSYIPLGLTDKNNIVCYLKASKMVVSFGKNEKDELYTDTHNVIKPPSKEVLNKFYFETRMLCRNIGPIKNYVKIKEGIHPINKNYYYYDTQRVYQVKENKVIKVDPMSIISNDCVLCKDKNHSNTDLTTVKKLDNEEVMGLLNYINIFKFKPLDYKLLGGWIIQSLICGGLPYRTPIWIVAPTGTGKSKLTDSFIDNFFLFYERKTGRQTTPKWLHRYFNGKAIPLQRDEFDPSKRHASDTCDEMEVVRTTTTERFPQRGISSGLDDSTTEFSYCFSPFYTSIQKPRELGDADLARFVFLKLKRGYKKDFIKKLEEFNNLMDNKMKSRLLLSALLKMFKIKNAYNHFMAKAININAGHEKSSYIMLMCCWNMFASEKERLSFKDDIIPLIKSKISVENSRIFIDCLKFTMKRSAYAWLEDQILFEVLVKMEKGKKDKDDFSNYKNFCNSKGFYLSQDDRFLYLHETKAVIFLEHLAHANKEPIKQKNLLSELEEDGNLYVKKVTIKESHKYKLTPGAYLMFNWAKTKKVFLGG